MGIPPPQALVTIVILYWMRSPTLIDTVKFYGFEEFLRRIKEVIEPSKIRYIISNHTEMDHSGAILPLLEFCPQAEIVCSLKGKEGLYRHFKKDLRFKIVEMGDTLKIGRRTLKFFLTSYGSLARFYCYLLRGRENFIF